MTNVEKVKIQLSRCQGLVEGIYGGIQIEDFDKKGVLSVLNQLQSLLQECQDYLSKKENLTEPKY
jgi:hypothetical protein